MPTSLLLNNLKIKLIQNGFSYKYTDRIINELKEHREDILTEILETGEKPNIAEKKADKRIGDINQLSDNFKEGLKNSSFIGRHSGISFILFPILLFVCSLFFIVFFGEIVVFFIELFKDNIDWSEDPFFSIAFWYYNFFNYSIYLFITIGFCLLCNKLLYKLKWAGITCLIMSVIGLFSNISISKAIPDPNKYLEYGLSLNVFFSVSSKMFFSFDFLSNYIRFILPIAFFIIFYISKSLNTKKLLKII